MQGIINGIGLFMGFIGAIILWKFSYGYEAVGAFMDMPVLEIGQRNKRRQIWQQVGIALIAAGFLFQFIGLFVKPS
jgi:hypothetical protein